MNNTYTDLVKQTFNYPQEDFVTQDGNLHFNDLDIKALIREVWHPDETHLSAENRHADQKGEEDVCQCA